jgi:hypothetical protein
LSSTTAPLVLSIVLTAAVDRVAVDDPVPVTVEVRNVSPAPLWVVGVVDGAEGGARYPRWMPIVEGPDGAFPLSEASDFTSPLRPADFRRLEPGEGFDPTVAAGGAAYFPLATFGAVSQRPGRYTLALELDTAAPDDRAWQGSLPDRRPTAVSKAAQVRERLASVPRLRVRSNTVSIDVEP